MKTKPVRWFYVITRDDGRPIGDCYHTSLACRHLVRTKHRVRSHRASTPPAPDYCNECKARERREARRA